LKLVTAGGDRGFHDALQRSTAVVAGRSIEYALIDSGAARSRTIVMLHEGLGSLTMWKDFPLRVAQATRSRVLVYSRYGHGWSDGLAERRTARFMHDEAHFALPQLLDQLDIRNPILLGHSDGASIALIHAGGSGRRVSGLIVLAPHVMVEDLTVTSIAAAKVAFETTDLRQRLARYHADVDSTFWGWNNIWLDAGFRAWNIEEFLPHIRCPILACQGKDDRYGTMEQIKRISSAVSQVQAVELEHCGHSPHRDRSDSVLAAIAGYIDRLRG
jgi:pimeloyl-ACP methyl ester carboxylesterase